MGETLPAPSLTDPAAPTPPLPAEGWQAAGEVCSHARPGARSHLPVLGGAGRGRPSLSGSEAARRGLPADADAPPRGLQQGAAAPAAPPVTVSSVSTPACPPLVSARLHQARASSHTPFLPSRVYHARFPAAQIPPPARCLLQCPEDGPRHPGGPGARSSARVPVTLARVPRPTSGLTRSPRPRKAARPPTRRSAPPFRAGGRFVWRSLLASGLGGKRDCAGVAPGREWPGSGGWATPLKVHVNARAHGA